MKHSFIFILSFISFNLSSFSQQPSLMPQTKGSLGISDANSFDKFLTVVAGIGSSAKDLLNEQSIKSYMMPPRLAGKKSNSVTYALSSALEYYLNLNNNYKDNLSPDFIRLQLPQGSVEDNLTFLSTTGTVSAAILPFDSPNLTPSVYSAVKYKIKNYIKLFQPTTRPQQKLYDLRKAIMRGNPVIVELQITNEFKNLKQSRFWHANTGDTTAAGTQFLVVVGYDEERKAVELLNSWGREWGNGGYIWVSYEDFGNLAQSGYVLIL
ncbi:MAG: C1 family peptidase [Saprospiraceae bacterium]|nr:C1 family peptidase [Saprospiraceae bacterium]